MTAGSRQRTRQTSEMGGKQTSDADLAVVVAPA